MQTYVDAILVGALRYKTVGRGNADGMHCFFPNLRAPRVQFYRRNSRKRARETRTDRKRETEGAGKQDREIGR